MLGWFAYPQKVTRALAEVTQYLQAAYSVGLNHWSVKK
jgi:hypothetical protein